MNKDNQSVRAADPAPLVLIKDKDIKQNSMEMEDDFLILPEDEISADFSPETGYDATELLDSAEFDTLSSQYEGDLDDAELTELAENLGEEVYNGTQMTENLLHPTDGHIFSLETSHSDPEIDTLNRPSNWKHAAKIVAHAFTPRKVLQKKENLSSESLDLRSMAQRMAGTTHLTFASVISKLNPVTILSKPLASYHIVVTISFVLTIFGLIMVQSASSVKAITTVGSAYSMFTLQVIFVAIGLVLFGISLRVRMEWLRQMALFGLIVTTLLLTLVLVPGIGLEVNSARRWFSIFGLSLQPSELVKVTLCVWGAHLLASRQFKNANFQELLFPLLPVAALISILIILEPSLSTMIIIVIIVSSLLWFAGLPLRIFAAIGVIAVILIGLLSLSAGYRAQRVMSFLGIIHSDMGANYQSLQAHYALASGGLFGLGLGQSKSKWNYLPNEYNDFIFAVVGEELGFIGAVCLVLLFLGLTFIGIRITLRSVDPYLRLLAGSITCLISGQALINIGYVVGILPVTGVQLPLISAGGTSALTNLVLLGLLANIARHEPDAIMVLMAKHRSRRIFALPLPKPYTPNAVEKRRLKVHQEKISGLRVSAPTYTKRAAAEESKRSASRTVRDSSYSAYNRTNISRRYSRSEMDRENFSSVYRNERDMRARQRDISKTRAKPANNRSNVRKETQAKVREKTQRKIHERNYEKRLEKPARNSRISSR